MSTITVWKWLATITLVFVVGSNAFDTLYNVVYPWNILAGAVSSSMLIRVSIVENDRPYLMLNGIIAVLYWVGFVQGVL